MTDLHALRERWIEERPDYADLGEHVATALRRAAQDAGISCVVTSRAKELPSLLRKAIRKGYADPWNEIHDKAGVRVTLTFRSDVSRLEDIVRRLFTVEHYEDKAQQAAPQEFGYLGVHFEVRLAGSDAGKEESKRQRGKLCEIQVHTRAQNLWADVSHQLLYKPVAEAPAEVQRAVYRQVALLELFDKEVEAAREAIRSMPGYADAQMLDDLQQHLLRFTTRDTDPRLSAKVVACCRKLLGEDDPESQAARVGSFVSENADKLTELHERYRDDTRCSPFLFQPESLLIFILLEKDPFSLRETWQSAFPDELLAELAVLWGVPLDD